MLSVIYLIIDDDGDDTDDDDDDDNITLEMPETQKSPSMACKNNFTFFTSFLKTYHLTFRLDSFSFLFFYLKVK